MIALIEWLPMDAAIWRATGQAWTMDTELQAATVELIDGIRRMYLQAHSKKGTKLPEPIHIRRPWEKEKTRARPSGTTLTELMNMTPKRRRPQQGGEQ